ncbi:MAG TPA: beta/gamma crystallin-related protein [Caldimonas sp.]|nr:beta/gamma crystallin-related protein [Caldimonas sp.]HEX2541824.1 beta/gamma crystallin-related protein [Caldimonas sp.]
MSIGSKLARAFLWGGIACGAAGGAVAGEITLYDHPQYGGAKLTLRNGTADLANTGFNDRTSSIVVHSGEWEVCSEANFGGMCVLLTPGRYAIFQQGLDDQVSSLRERGDAGESRRGDDGRGGRNPVAGGQGGRVLLFRGSGLSGESLSVSSAVPDLTRSNFNDSASSLAVESGTWVVCRDSQYRGDCRTFGPGRYANLGDMSNAISSIRPGSDAPAYRGDSRDDRRDERGDERRDDRRGDGRRDDGRGADRDVRGDGRSGDGGIEFFSERGFAGERLRIDRDMGDLSRSNFNDRAQSVIVREGAWELCSDARFGGNCTVLRRGEHARLGSLGGQVSSVRRVR